MIFSGPLLDRTAALAHQTVLDQAAVPADKTQGWVGSAQGPWVPGPGPWSQSVIRIPVEKKKRIYTMEKADSTHTV